jgi:hypothetical protein
MEHGAALISTILAVNSKVLSSCRLGRTTQPPMVDRPGLQAGAARNQQFGGWIVGLSFGKIRVYGGRRQAASPERFQ